MHLLSLCKKYHMPRLTEKVGNYFTCPSARHAYKCVRIKGSYDVHTERKVWRRPLRTPAFFWSFETPSLQMHATSHSELTFFVNFWHYHSPVWTYVMKGTLCTFPLASNAHRGVSTIRKFAAFAYDWPIISWWTNINLCLNHYFLKVSILFACDEPQNKYC